MLKRLPRLSLSLTALVATIAVATGVAPIPPTPVALVHADGCQPVNDTCTGNDVYKTSVLTVNQ